VQIGATAYVTVGGQTAASIKQYKGCGKNYAYTYVWQQYRASHGSYQVCTSIVTGRTLRELQCSSGPDAAIAATGIYLMRAALTITPPVDLTGVDGLVGSIGAGLLGIATALTASRSRITRTITGTGLAIGYAIVFTYSTSGALIIGYLVALTWWGLRLATHTLRLAFPAAGAALHRLLNGRAT
jgi:hypothetical protein